MERHQLRTLTPGDAAVALRSYARRFGELFRPDELAGGPDTIDLLHPAPGTERAPLAVVAAATTAFTELRRAVEQTLALDRPELAPSLLERQTRDRAPLDATAPRAAVDGLAGAATALAEVVGRAPLNDWTRTARVGGAEVEAMELLREAVASGRTYLDDLAASLDAARRAVR